MIKWILFHLFMLLIPTAATVPMAVAMTEETQRDDQGIDQRLDNQIVVEQLDIPVQRKAGEIGAAFGLIKGKEYQNADGGVQKIP